MYCFFSAKYSVATKGFLGTLQMVQETCTIVRQGKHIWVGIDKHTLATFPTNTNSLKFSMN